MNANSPLPGPTHHAAKPPASRRGNAGGAPTADGRGATTKTDFEQRLDQSKTNRRAGAASHASAGPEKNGQNGRDKTAYRSDRSSPTTPGARAHAGAPASSPHRVGDPSARGKGHDTAGAATLIRRWRLPAGDASVAPNTAGIAGQTFADARPWPAHRISAVRAGRPEPASAQSAAPASQPDPKSDAGPSRSHDKIRRAALALVAPGLSPSLLIAPPAAAGRRATHDDSGEPIVISGRGGQSAGTKNRPARALAQWISQAEHETAGGSGSGPNAAQSPPGQTLSPHQIEALVQILDSGSKSDLSLAPGHSASQATSAPGQSDLLSSNPAVLANVAGSAQSGPNAAIAGGAAGQAAGASPASGLAPGLGAPLGSDGWQAALGQHTLRLARGATRQAQIQLHPRALGQLSIAVTVNEHNQAQLHLASPHAHVREAVESALPQLKQSLAAGGLSLGGASVGDQNSQAAFADTGGRGPSGRGSSRSAPAIDAIGEAEPVPAARDIAGPRGGIDIFA